MRAFFVGGGLIGRKRAKAATSLGIAPSGVFDTNCQSADSFAAEFACPVFPTLDALLKHTSSEDIVFVSTTHDALTASAVAVLEQGTHLFVEKPGARTTAELRLIERAASGRSVAVGYNHRFHPSILSLFNLTRNETPFSVRARYGHGGRPGYELEWRARKSTSGGGELLDQASHLIDLVNFFAGPFRLIVGHVATLHWPMEVEDNVWLLGTIANEGRASLHASWTEWKNIFHLEAFFHDAKAECIGLGGSYGPESFVLSEMPAEMGPPSVLSRTFVPGRDDSWRLEIEDYLTELKSGQTGMGARLADAIHVLEVVDEVYTA